MDIEEKLNLFLNEMAEVCKKTDGLGILIRIYSGEHEPIHCHVFVHCHVFDLNKKELGQFLLTDKRPQSYLDIQSYRCDLDLGIKRKIFEWSKGKSKKGFNNWDRYIDTWNDLNTN